MQPLILFQNENFVVCDKRAQVLSVPARESNDPRPCLGLELQKHLQSQVFPVHRLDYEVSGLILYALNSFSHKESQKWFQEKKIFKLYSALTCHQDFSHWPLNISTDRSIFKIEKDQTFFWKTKILRGKKRSFESEQGEWAETQASIIGFSEKFIKWKLSPLTGKSHQLRFELSRRGFPILGDNLYGSSHKALESGIALKAYELDLSIIKNKLGLPEKITLPNWNWSLR